MDHSCIVASEARICIDKAETSQSEKPCHRRSVPGKAQRTNERVWKEHKSELSACVVHPLGVIHRDPVFIR